MELAWRPVNRLLEQQKDFWHKSSDMKSIQENCKHMERSRHLYRIVCNIILYAVQAAIFYYIWMHFYNPYFRNSYVFKGNIFATAVYMAIMLLMNRLYGFQRLGLHRSVSLVFGLSISAVLANIAAYFFVIIQAATWILSPLPAIVYMSLMDIALACVWSLTFNRIFRIKFPPNRLVLVTSNNVEDVQAKFAVRSDRYDVSGTIFVTSDGRHAGPGTDGIKYVSYAGLHSIYDELSGYDGVIVGDLTAELRNDVIKNCYARRIRTYTLPKLTDVILKSSEILQVFDTPLLMNRNSGLESGEAFLKRASDICMSLAGLIIGSPFMLAIAISIKLEDGGPVFYRQKRCTINGRVFEILKFRSMIVNAEASGISVPATDNDPRITKTGRIIRATRLDELPQLINILKGDMSVVGPRPERIEHVEEYCRQIPEFRYRMCVKGGLTGYAQVYGKYNTSAYDKLKLDLMYIENYSLILDLEIILRTIQVMFTKESTEGFNEESSRRMTDASRGKGEK